MNRNCDLRIIKNYGYYFSLKLGILNADALGLRKSNKVQNLTESIYQKTLKYAVFLIHSMMKKPILKQDRIVYKLYF
jgi:hypothetical protein